MRSSMYEMVIGCVWFSPFTGAVCLKSGIEPFNLPIFLILEDVYCLQVGQVLNVGKLVDKKRQMKDVYLRMEYLSQNLKTCAFKDSAIVCYHSWFRG